MTMLVLVASLTSSFSEFSRSPYSVSSSPSSTLSLSARSTSSRNGTTRVYTSGHDPLPPTAKQRRIPSGFIHPLRPVVRLPRRPHLAVLPLRSSLACHKQRPLLRTGKIFLATQEDDDIPDNASASFLNLSPSRCLRTDRFLQSSAISTSSTVTHSYQSPSTVYDYEDSFDFDFGVRIPSGDSIPRFPYLISAALSRPGYSAISSCSLYFSTANGVVNRVPLRRGSQCTRNDSCNGTVHFCDGNLPTRHCSLVALY